MQLQQVDQSEFTSIFGGSSTAAPVNKDKESGFGGFNDVGSMFVPTPSKEEDKKVDEPITPTDIKEVNPEEQEEILKEVTEDKTGDSMFKGSETKVEGKGFDTVRSIFEDLIKSNQLLPLADDKLETAEDIQALVYSNVMHKVDELRNDENNAWYASKSPAWRAVAEFSEKAQHPSELIPFIQSVQTIEKVADLDPKTEEDAEKIVRMALLSRKEPQDIIDDTISTYKDNGKLTNLAEKYQPAIIQAEQAKLAAETARQQREEQEHYQMITHIHEEAVKVLETPFLGKHKMKKEEKAAIYNMIAAPDENTGGYRIFSEIDNLYETKNFDKLRKIALLLQDEKAYDFYLGIDTVAKNTEGLLRKIKTTPTGSTASDVEEPSNTGQKLARLNQRNNESGFGYFTK